MNTLLGGLDPSLYCLPVELKNGVFRPKPDSALNGSDLPTVRELAPLLAARYAMQSGRVQIGKNVYAGPVLLPKHGKGHSYAIVDHNGHLTDSPQGRATLSEKVLSIGRRTNPVVWRSEALTPFESVDLRHAFIEPEFVELSATGAVIAKRSWWSVIAEPRAIIFGGPGSGKSTCLRRIALEQEESDDDEPSRIPIYIQLRHIQSKDSLAAVSRSLFAEQPLLTGPTDLDGSFIPDDLSNALLLLDGMDEVPSHLQQEVLGGIEQLAKSGTSAAIVVSTREYGYQWKIPGFKYFRILPLTENKVREWVYYRLTADPPVPWRKFIASFEQSPKIRDLCCNPLLLSIAVSSYRRSRTLPTSKAVLLESCLDAVADRWDSSRGVVRDAESWASPKMKIAALSRTAFFLNVAAHDAFSVDDFCSWNRPLAADRHLLLALQRHTGLVTQVDDQDRWSFVHRTIADYLTARYVVFDTDDSAKTLRALMKRDRWRDVWSYSCGIAHDATPLVLMVLDDAGFGRAHRFEAIADAFSQDLFVSEDASKRALKEVKAFVSATFKSLLLGSRPQKAKGQTAVVTKVHFEDDRVASASLNARRRQLESVVSALSALTRGQLGEALLTWLGESEYEPMRALARLLEDETTLSAITAVEGTRLLLTVVQERPDFGLDAEQA